MRRRTPCSTSFCATTHLSILTSFTAAEAWHLLTAGVGISTLQSATRRRRTRRRGLRRTRSLSVDSAASGPRRAAAATATEGAVIVEVPAAATGWSIHRRGRPPSGVRRLTTASRKRTSFCRRRPRRPGPTTSANRRLRRRIGDDATFETHPTYRPDYFQRTAPDGTPPYRPSASEKKSRPTLYICQLEIDIILLFTTGINFL